VPPPAPTQVQPEPYYADDYVTLYHGDCLATLGALSGLDLAAVVTDPPYASGARTEASKSSSGAMLRGERWASKPIENDQMTTTGFVWLIREVCYAVRPMLSDGGSLLAFIDWRQWPNLIGAIESTNMRVNGMVVWDKQSYGLGNGFRAQHELICHASKGTPRIASRSTGNVLRAKRVPNDDHPSPKPVSLMESLLEVVAEPGELICDPFAGGGATLLAAKNLGLRAIGIEYEERHCETTAKRLAQDTLFGGVA
jgi:site-specific DNA-methyltransferase (adenine-specific)